MDLKQAHVAAQWKHDRPLTACRFDPNGSYVVTGSEDNVVSRFNTADGKKVTFNGGHETWVRGLSVTPDGKTIISGGCDGVLAWWDAAGDGSKPKQVVQGHQGWIRSVAISADGKWLASGGNDNRAVIWDAATGKLVHEIKFAKHVYNVSFHPGLNQWFAGDLMGDLRQLDVSSGKEIAKFDAKDLHTYHAGQQTDFGGIRGIAINPKQKVVAAGGTYKGTNPFGAIHEPLVLIFDLESGKLQKKLLAPGIKRGGIWRLQWINDDWLCGVCGGGDGGFLIFWDLKSDKDFHRFKLPSLARDMDFHAASEQIVTAHYDRTVRITKLAKKA